jgi:prevent-host-death family protein
MRSMTADAAKRKFGALLKAADNDFVAITRHGKLKYVLLPAWAFGAYEKIREAQTMGRILLTVETAAAKVLDKDESEAKVLREANSLMRKFLEEPRQRF